ncbi:hypothetical protein M23134_01370 [Microscilla marina ATCC 23134]|uniref:Uncharacterized protein n=1 Tax=Microscilla marina ATCC 23134 TaxID=313606 RepID=A1ZJL3_MICM2|nr:hypothetical protein M23134_01370 [Microscilla marina ATCC 23134]
MQIIHNSNQITAYQALINFGHSLFIFLAGLLFKPFLELYNPSYIFSVFTIK